MTAAHQTLRGRKQGPGAPDGLGSSAAALWASVVEQFELEGHELVLLRHAVLTEDLCSQLQAALERSPVMEEGRVHPAAKELRLQRITLARQMAALQLPFGEDQADVRRQRRSGVRGAYGPRAVS